MQSIYQTAVSGFKEYIQSQLQVDGDVTLSIYTFDNYSEKVLDRVSLKDVRTQSAIDEKTATWFAPRGSTALYDAMARAINETGEKLRSTPEHLRPAKVLVVTITDGYENASRLVSQESLRNLIQQQSNVYKWDFVFIGANQDAVLTARDLGISLDAAMTFNATLGGTEAVYKSLSKGTLSTRYAAAAGREVNYAFSEEDRSAALDAGK
jgi:hypothetical protein